jgi:transposase
MLDVETGEVEERVLQHQGDEVREFYAGLPGPVRVGIEATGSMQWFLELMEEMGVECLVGHPVKIRAHEPRKQKNDRRDALLLMNLLAEDRFPTIWMPSVEQRDVRALLRHRHQWVRMRVIEKIPECQHQARSSPSSLGASRRRPPHPTVDPEMA